MDTKRTQDNLLQIVTQQEQDIGNLNNRVAGVEKGLHNLNDKMGELVNAVTRLGAQPAFDLGKAISTGAQIVAVMGGLVYGIVYVSSTHHTPEIIRMQDKLNFLCESMKLKDSSIVCLKQGD